MSGGVDSSVAAHLLTEQGHEVTGVFMRHGERAVSACAVDGRREHSPLLPVLNPRAAHKQGCCSALDAEDGRRVAERLGIPFYALNLESEFRQIIDYFVDEYTIGRTPNPCVMCNNWIKFGKLFDYADSINADFVATGHYARLVSDSNNETPALIRGQDKGKDQSYVLFGINRKYLDRMLLPVGDFEKQMIRQIAGELGLDVAQKKDSQEICFVTSGKHDEFVRARQRDGTDTAGEFVTTDGTVVGRHADALDAFQERFWNYYASLQDYRAGPTEELAAKLRLEFDELFSTRTGYETLDDRIRKTESKRDDLLTVLSDPSVPLHNNASELGARVSARRRDVSLHSRSQRGVRAMDIFTTLVQTSKKLGLSAYAYLRDRLSGSLELPTLAQSILQAAASG